MSVVLKVGLFGIVRSMRRLWNSGEMTTNDDWYDLFEEYDKDHDGRIPIADLQKFIGDDAAEFSLTRPEVCRLIKEADINKDGFIDLNEFNELMLALKEHYGGDDDDDDEEEEHSKKTPPAKTKKGKA